LVRRFSSPFPVKKHHVGEYPEVQRDLMAVADNPKAGPITGRVGHGNAGEIFP
jgi:hypothetical protein